MYLEVKNLAKYFDSDYPIRFFKAWSIGLPIAIATSLLVGPIAKKFVDRITK